LSEALDPLSRLADAEFSPDVAKMLADNVLKDNSKPCSGKGIGL
jgi:hypothetical protein